MGEKEESKVISLYISKAENPQGEKEKEGKSMGGRRIPMLVCQQCAHNRPPERGKEGEKRKKGRGGGKSTGLPKSTSIFEYR